MRRRGERRGGADEERSVQRRERELEIRQAALDAQLGAQETELADAAAGARERLQDLQYELDAIGVERARATEERKRLEASNRAVEDALIEAEAARDTATQEEQRLAELARALAERAELLDQRERELEVSAADIEQLLDERTHTLNARERDRKSVV